MEDFEQNMELMIEFASVGIDYQYSKIMLLMSMLSIEVMQVNWISARSNFKFDVLINFTAKVMASIAYLSLLIMKFVSVENLPKLYFGQTHSSIWFAHL